MNEHTRHSKRVTATRRWQVLRMAVIERDGFRCRACGARGRLEVDHVKPVRTHPHLAYEPTNLQALCPSCHTKKTRVEIGHRPGDPRRDDWKKSLRAFENQPSPATQE